MAKKDPYVAAPKQSEIPTTLCERAAWYLSASIGRDLHRNEARERYRAVYDAFTALNIPVHCRIERKGGVRRAVCACYSPLSGLSGNRKRKRGGKRRAKV